MDYFAPPVERLIEEFARLPGIGQKSAQRLAFHVLDMPKEDAERFASAIREAKEKTFTCKRCQNLTDSEECPICADKSRDQKTICVVADPRDVIAFERTKEYRGLYHVLHGTLSPMGHVGPDDIRIRELVQRIADEGKCINILDTPGHQDFSEDTYRTLMAADAAVMVIDASKGVEAQTRKLFKVCAMRGVPIFTFINKMDREARDPYELLEDIENELGIGTYAVNWPIGSGKRFKGVYDRMDDEVIAFEGADFRHEVKAQRLSIDDPILEGLLPEDQYQTLIDDVELLSGAGDEFDLKAVHEGRLSPVFFGSALTNFGVEPFLKKFLQMTPPPTARTADIGVIDPFDPHFSAFVFKIQANMNKAHRDRVAFMRICSGKFERGQEVLHVQSGKKMSLAAPQQLMAQDRSIVDEAYAGDIIGIFDPGVFSIGDTVCDPKHKCVFSGIPTFAPELFAVVRQKDTLKRKQFVKGVEQIAQEGAIQIFREPNAGMESVIVGVVGVLQFEVLEYRLKNEYNVEIIRENLPYEHVRWVENDEEDFDVKRLQLTSDTKIVEDLRGNTLLLFTSPWNITYATDHNEGLRLAEFSENA